MLEAVKKLREFMSDQFVENGKTWSKGAEIINEIEDEIAANYIRLPCDTDGIPWTLETESFVDDTGRKVKFSGLQVDREWRWKILHIYVQHDPSLCHHVKPRTLEDILEEYANEHYKLVRDGLGSIATLKMKKAADEIRELCCQNEDKKPLQGNHVSNGVYAVCDKQTH